MSQQVLYRVFRPQNFSEVVNQEAVKTTLKNAVASGTVAHAYLFTGPRGVGKTSLARILAKAVNCLKNDPSPSGQARASLPSKEGGKKGGTALRFSGEPCGRCGSCQAIFEGRFLDLIEIDAASHTGVDNVREIIEHVKFSPSSGRYKVIVIDEVHMLSRGAFNALLKTLEEPPAHAIFILATTEINKVPATIVSRTQRFDFKRLSQSDIAGQLEKVAGEIKTKIPKEVVKLIARASEGSMRDGFSLLDQLLAFGIENLTLNRAEDILGLSSLGQQQDFFTLVTEKQTPEAYAFLKSLSGKGADMLQFANGFLEYIDMVIGFSLRGGEDADLGLAAEDLEVLTRHARIPRIQLVAMAEIFLAASAKIKNSPLPELPFEIAAIRFMEQTGGKAENNPPVFINSAGISRNPAAAVDEAGVEKSQKPGVSKLQDSDISTPGEDFLPEIRAKWNDFLSRLKEYNHSLISSLKLATIVQSDGKSLLVAFPYRFHKETIEQRKNKIVVEKVLEEIYGHPIRIQCCMNHETDTYQAKTENPKTSLMDEALKVFRIKDNS